MNQIMIVGSAVRDQDIQFNKHGDPVVNVLVVSRKPKQKAATDENHHSTFFHCIIHGKIALMFNSDENQIKKNERMLIIGEIRDEKWISKDGTPKRDSRVYVSKAFKMKDGK